MDISTERVTPAKAELWLNSNHSNRKMREGVAEKYAADMKAGKWTQCPEPISFYEDGELADGQHRLWAIVESGVTITFPVARNLRREDGLNLNTGLGRSIVDNGRISGVDTNLSTTLISTARAIEEGTGAKGSKSNAQRLELVNKHREAAEWAISNGPRTKLLRNAVVLAALGRAYYYVDNRDKLRRFCDVLGSGLPDSPAEFAAVAIRKYLMEKGAVCSSAAMWTDTFLKVQNAISYFMAGKSLTVVKSVNDEAYPLGRKGRRK